MRRGGQTRQAKAAAVASVHPSPTPLRSDTRDPCPAIRPVLSPPRAHPPVAGAAAAPRLLSLRSLGKSFEGRDIWLLAITNQTAGDDTEKPAFWVHGNLHAAEITASTACLYWLHQLITGTQDWVYEHLGALFWTVEIWSRPTKKPASPTTCGSTGTATTRSRTTSSW